MADADLFSANNHRGGFQPPMVRLKPDATAVLKPAIPLMIEGLGIRDSLAPRRSMRNV